MYSLDFFDSHTSYIKVDIKHCALISHDQHWQESGTKSVFDLWLITEGEVSITLQNTVFTAKPHDVVFLYPHMLYEAHTNIEGCSFIYLHFDFTIGSNSRALVDYPFAGFIHNKAIHLEVDLFLKGFELYTNHMPLSFFTLHGYFSILLSKILQFQHENTGFHEHQPTGVALLEPVFDYISLHFDKNIKIIDLSLLIGLSEKYFITFFKKAVGISPWNYINQIKMNKALDYLYQNKHSIKEISNLLGYPDPYCFSKAFKKYHKTSPSDFKKTRMI